MSRVRDHAVYAKVFLYNLEGVLFEPLLSDGQMNTDVTSSETWIRKDESDYLGGLDCFYTVRILHTEGLMLTEVSG